MTKLGHWELTERLKSAFRPLGTRLQSAGNRATCIGDGQSRPARVRTPRASDSRAMTARVVSPARWISAITVRVVALLVVCSDLAAGAFAFGGAFVLRSHMVKSQHVQ